MSKVDIVGGRDGWKEVKRFWADSGHLQLYVFLAIPTSF